MELITRDVKQNIEKALEIQQVTFDDDYVIKDNKPDVQKIICQTGMVKTDDIKQTGETIWVTGNIEFEVLYKSDDEGEKVETIKDLIPFQEKITLDGVENSDNIRVYAKINDLSAGIINSRKISVRGLIDLEVYVETEGVTAISQRVDSSDIQQMSEDVPMLELKGDIRDVIRVHSQIQLPKTKPNIWKILCSFIDIRNMEYGYENNHITISAELHACILYLSEEQEICFQEKVENFTNEINCDNADESCIVWIRAQTVMQQVQVENDYDGEMRQVDIEAALSVDGKVWQQQMITVLRDMYSIKGNVRPCYETVKKTRLLMKNETKCRVMEQFYRDANADRILRTCGNKCIVQVEQIKNCDNGIIVSGYLVIRSINVVENDTCPIQMQTDTAAFEQFVEIPGIDANTYREIYARADQVQINFMDNSEYEVKATLSINVLALVQEDMEVITQVEQFAGQDEGEQRAGLTGYIVRKDEKLWNIAKNYHTTVENIMKINDLSSDQVKENDRLIIARLS